MNNRPEFNVCDAQISEEIYVEFLLEDGRTVIITCQSSADAQKVVNANIHGIITI